MVASALLVASLRPRLAADYARVRETSDIYGLPAPEHTLVVSLGWRAALADLLWGHVLVSQGLHFQAKRRFEFLGNYLDTINTLDPQFREPYRLADTLLTLQPVKARVQDHAKAREVLERGLAARPYDAALWSTAGQFVAYLAPQQLPESMRQEWRLAGARMLARACELVTDNENIPYHCITAARLLSSGGQREATIQFLERLLAVNDDPEIRAMALNYLERAIGEREREQAEQRTARFREAWKSDLGFVSKDLMLVLGPRFDPFACAGVGRADAPECAATWKEWAMHANDATAR
jgi:tetratricopeptide (TPR) repeat protein